MSLSDDDVVGRVQTESCDDNGTAYSQPRIVHFRDLDPHIQDRLRAADEMAEDLRAIAREASNSMGGPLWKQQIRLKGIQQMAVQTLAAYEATFGGSPDE